MGINIRGKGEDFHFQPSFKAISAPLEGLPILFWTQEVCLLKGEDFLVT